MNSVNQEYEIRPMVLSDLDQIFAVDHIIRRTEKPITYANLTTERIFSIDRHVGRNARPMSYIDLIRGDVSDLLEYGFVAEIGDKVRGFILGRLSYLSDTADLAGEIIIVGVHPEHQRKGVASALFDAIIEKFQEVRIKSVKVDVHQNDEKLKAFVYKLGFETVHFVKYSRPV